MEVVNVLKEGAENVSGDLTGYRPTQPRLQFFRGTLSTKSTIHAHSQDKICRMMMSTSAAFAGRCHDVVAREEQRLLPTGQHAIQQFTDVLLFAKR